MGLSGLVGAGAQAGLEDLLARQLAEQQMQLRIRAMEAEEANRKRSLDLQERQIASMDEDRKFGQAAEAMRLSQAEATAKAAADKAAYDETARANMSELTNDPAQMEAFGVASGQLKPIDIFNLRKARDEAAARETPDQKAKREIDLYRAKKEVDADPKYRPPSAAAKPDEPKYIQVVEPDGKLQMMTADEIRSQGGVPTQKAGASQDVERRQAQAVSMIDAALGTISKMKDMPGKSGAIGAKGPSSLFGYMDRPIEGTNAANYRQMLETLKSQLALPKLEIMRGLGQMSNREFETVQKAATAIDHMLSEGVYDQELSALESSLQRSRGLVGGGSAAPEGSSGSAPAPGTEGVVNGIPAVWDGKGWKPK